MIILTVGTREVEQEQIQAWNLKGYFSTDFSTIIIILWQFSVPCYHFPIEMHNSFFFLLLGACLHGELSGGGLALSVGETVACGVWRCLCHRLGLSSSLLGPTAVQKEGIQLRSDTLRHVAKAWCFKRIRWKYILCLYLPCLSHLVARVGDS